MNEVNVKYGINKYIYKCYMYTYVQYDCVCINIKITQIYINNIE